MRSLVMTVIGPDRPGLVEDLSTTVANHNGNWLESRMSHLAGHFAGLLRVECPEEDSSRLLEALRALDDLSVIISREIAPARERPRTISFEIVGNDRPGIVQELSSAIVRAGGNVEELVSGLESAPHAGHPVFRASGSVAVSADFEDAVLVNALEDLGPDLAVSLEG
ncbi:MAG: glycine cleavage system protein R [Verrucomicrobiaceae bacterium]|nr:glycine cleavage system protein R [Verrucomicrobiaceae bacterium]